MSYTPTVSIPHTLTSVGGQSEMVWLALVTFEPGHSVSTNIIIIFSKDYSRA